MQVGICILNNACFNFTFLPILCPLIKNRFARYFFLVFYASICFQVEMARMDYLAYGVTKNSSCIGKQLI